MSYFIKIEDTFYYLDATTKITVSRSASLSKNPLYSGGTSSDNHIVKVPTVKISGVISDIKSYGALSDLGTPEYLNAIESAINNSIPVAVKYRLDEAEEFGWMITRFNHTQDNENGYSVTTDQGEIRQSFKVEITLEKPIVTSSVDIRTKPKAIYAGLLSEKTSSSQTVQGFNRDGTKEELLEYTRAQKEKIASRIEGLVNE